MEWDLWFKHWPFCDLASVYDNYSSLFCLIVYPMFALSKERGLCSEQWISVFFKIIHPLLRGCLKLYCSS